MATAKKAAPKKKVVSTKTTGKKSSKQEPLKSFHIYKESTPFATFQITRQTVYWVILVAFIVFVQLWVLKLQIEVASLIEAQQMSLSDEE